MPVPRKACAWVAPIATGEKVITADKQMGILTKMYQSITKTVKTEMYQLIIKTYNDVVAVEMEGLGFLTVIEASSVQGIVIRGISDLLDKSDEHDAKWQPIAAQNAAAFAFAMLDKLEGEPPVVLHKLKKLEEYREHFSEEDMAILRREVFLKYF